MHFRRMENTQCKSKYGMITPERKRIPSYSDSQQIFKY